MPEMAAKLYISVSKNDIEMKEFILRFGRMVVIASSCFLLGITNASAQKCFGSQRICGRYGW